MSAPPCPSTYPKYYPITLYIIADISFPVNLMGFYMVWFQSPKMRGYRFCLGYLQLVSFLTEIHMSWLCPGFYLFPLIGGYKIGGDYITTHLSMSIWVTIFAFELPSTLLCFIYRHNAAENINQTSSNKIFSEKLPLVLVHLFPFATGFCMWKSNLTYEQKYSYLKDNWPQCLHFMPFDNFEVYDYILNAWLAVTGIGAVSFVFLFYTYCMSLGIHTMIILQRFRKSMSRQTYQMHKTALFSLIMQILIPGVLIVIPLGICMFVVVTGAIGLQGFATNTMFLVGSHSMCSSTVMILSNPKYRQVLKEKIRKVFRLKKKTTNPRGNGNSVEPSQRKNSFIVSNVSIISQNIN